MRARREAGDRRVSNIVFMGMGEPLANFDPTWAAVAPPPRRRRHRRPPPHRVDGRPGARHPQAGHRADLPVNLAVSLHAANDELRNELVPINRRYPLGPADRRLRGVLDGHPPPGQLRVGAHRGRQRPVLRCRANWPRSPGRCGPTSTSSRSTPRPAIPPRARRRNRVMRFRDALEARRRQRDGPGHPRAPTSTRPVDSCGPDTRRRSLSRRRARTTGARISATRTVRRSVRIASTRSLVCLDPSAGPHDAALNRSLDDGSVGHDRPSTRRHHVGRQVVHRRPAVDDGTGFGHHVESIRFESAAPDGLPQPARRGLEARGHRPRQDRRHDA